MRPHARLASCLLRAAALCACASTPALAGPFTFGLAAGTTYYQHAFSSSSSSQFQSRSLEPLVRFDRYTARSRFLLEVRRKFDVYSGTVIGPVLGGTRQIQDHAELRLHHAWRGRDRFDATGFYLRARDLLDVDQRTLTLQTQVAEWSGSANAVLGRMEGSVQGRGWAYDAPQFQDAMARTWTLRYVPVRQMGSEWFIGWHRRELTLGSQTAIASHVVAAGLRRVLGSGIAAEMEAGASRVTYADGLQVGGGEAAISLERATEGPNGLSARLQVERAFPALVVVHASHRVGAGRAWLIGESLVDAVGGVYRYPTFTRRLGAGVEDTLSRALVIGFEATRGNFRPFHVQQPSADVVEASTWFVRRMRPWLSARAGCSWLSQTGANGSGALSFDRMRFDATLIAVNP